MEKDEWKIKYLKLRKKYTELKKDFLKIKTYCIKLKENNEIDRGQIEFLTKENENLKEKFKQAGEKIGTLNDSNQTSMIEEQYSQFFGKISNKVESTGRLIQAKPDQSVYSETENLYEGFFIIGAKPATNTSAKPMILYEQAVKPFCLPSSMRSLLPDLCFPQGIEIKQVTLICETIDCLISKENITKRSNKQFILTLRTENTQTSYSSMPNSDHELLYFICTETFEIEKTNECS